VRVTYADLVHPATRRRAALYEAALVVGSSLLVALCARLAVQLPFSPVPITGQTLAVLLVGALLGSRRGALSMALYLAEGMAGLPVFAASSPITGPARLMGPTGGYLVGFMLAAFLTGWLAERGWDRRVGSCLLAMAIGNAAIYLCGLIWLAGFVPSNVLLEVGLLPFLPGDLAKLALAAATLPAGWQLLRLASRE
jgi:biotin transporter BioY